ncbi:MAG: hydrogenase iron-sulfur subunit [Anaerolineae bacterium]|jgi:F420-non-reducing hydrogenase iron-sulfur subunit|nr:hydrogenase iron-sulfur subunit [Anaerolineae bacterium]
MGEVFEPKVVVFLCNWFYHAEIDSIEPALSHILPIRVLCSGQVSPEMIMRVFRAGVDGVLMLGCNDGDCHYISSGYHATRRAPLVRDLLGYVSIHPGRLQLDWVSLDEPSKFARVVQAFVEAVRALGPIAEDMGA